MPKIIFMKYSPPVKGKFVEIRHMCYFECSDLDFDVKNYFYEILTTCSAQIGPKSNI